MKYRIVIHIIITGLLGLFVIFSASAQDPIFSQFYSAPLQINPAFAGNTYAPRISVNFRNQWPNWPQAYNTFAVSYEQRIPVISSGLGIYAQGDVAGDGIWQSYKFTGVYAYLLQITDDLFIKWGAEAGIIQNRLDWDRLIFEDQIDPVNGLTDPAGNPYFSGETRPGDTDKILLDIGTGFLVYTERFYAGFSVKHMNRPNENFQDINNQLETGLPSRMTAHGGVQIPLNNIPFDDSFISPNIMYIKQGDWSQINAGAYLKISSFFAGGWFRYAQSNADAAIILVGAQKGVFKFGYSYDLTISNGLAGETGGSHEVSVVINLDDSERISRRRRESRYNDCFGMFR